MKKNSMMKFMALAFVGTLALTPISANAGTRKPTSISKISATKKTVTVGKKFELEVSTKQRNVNDNYFVWTTSNKNVVRITERDNTDDDMEFKAVGEGTATITCKIKGTNIKKTCKVTVKKASTKAYISVDDDGKGYITVELRDYEDLEARLVNATSSNRKLVYKSLTPSIVSVNQNGDVYGKKIGTGKIQITSKANSSIKKVVKVRVVWDD